MKSNSLFQFQTTFLSFSSSFVDPTSIPYLGLWMDAADSNTFVFATSNSFSQWNDKSSNSNSFSEGGHFTLYNVSNVVFNGSFFLYSSNTLSFDTNTYIFLVDSV